MSFAAYILKCAWTIAKSAYDMLMDRELPDAERARIKEIVLEHSDVIALHDLRTRASGPLTREAARSSNESIRVESRLTESVTTQAAVLDAIKIAATATEA